MEKSILNRQLVVKEGGRDQGCRRMFLAILRLRQLRHAAPSRPHLSQLSKITNKATHQHAITPGRDAASGNNGWLRPLPCLKENTTAPTDDTASSDSWRLSEPHLCCRTHKRTFARNPSAWRSQARGSALRPFCSSLALSGPTDQSTQDLF